MLPSRTVFTSGHEWRAWHAELLAKPKEIVAGTVNTSDAGS